jgi:hypothetical protein
MKVLRWMIAIAVVALTVPALAEPVTFAGRTIFYITASAAGKTPAQRVAEIDSRMIDILGETSITPAEVVIKKTGADRSIYVKGHLFAVATVADAKLAKTTVDKVAKSWRDQLAKNIDAMHLLPEQVGPTGRRK